MTQAPVILHVDDDNSMLKSLRRCLRNEPYRIISANGSQQAMSVARQEAIDLAILDVSMPGCSGLRLLKKLQRIHNNLPVIMLTAMVEDFVIYPAFNIDDRCYLQKPFEVSELKRKIAATLRQAPQQKERLVCQ